MKIRPQTWDTDICQSVLVDNEYNLPQNMEGMVVIDIGAHIGSFAVACHERGAKRVICYEPDPDNFKLLTFNIQSLENSVTVFELWDSAVTGVPTPNLKLRHLRNHNFGKGQNTGHIDVFGFDDTDTGITSVGINDVLAAVDEPVDLLKLDCEGSEWIIFEQGNFESVTKIVAELHVVVSGEHATAGRIKGVSLAQLSQRAVRMLCQKGFAPKVSSGNESVAMLTANKTSAVEVVSTNKVLWVGYAGIISGPANVTSNICKRLFERGWDVRVYGTGYTGAPHNMPYRVYSAETVTGVGKIVTHMEPDAIVVLDDHWNVSTYMRTLAALNMYPPVIGYIAVDSENVRRDVGSQLRLLKHAVFHTEFGLSEINKAGYAGSSSIAGHGVDTSIFTPQSKSDARSRMQIALSRRADIQDAFIWGVVAVNQPRKRLDLSLAYFAEWWKQAGKPDNAYIYFHCDVHNGVWDIQQLSDYLGIRGRVLTTQSQIVTESRLPLMYNVFDVMISTSEGESWGMTQQEGLACGIPQIAIKCGGMPYWAKDAIYWVESSQYVFTPNRTNTKRWIASEADFVAAMDVMYRDSSVRDDYSRRGLELVRAMPTWDDIAAHFHDVLLKTIKRTRDALITDPIDEF